MLSSKNLLVIVGLLVVVAFAAGAAIPDDPCGNYTF